MNKKILVVDDNKDILEGISILLEDEGYVVKTAIRGEETFDKVIKFKPHVILLDVLLSGSDGREICKRLKTDTRTAEIPVIMISAHPNAKKESLICGAEDFLAKPFEIDKLLEKIRKYFSQ